MNNTTRHAVVDNLACVLLITGITCLARTRGAEAVETTSQLTPQPPTTTTRPTVDTDASSPPPRDTPLSDLDESDRTALKESISWVNTRFAEAKKALASEIKNNRGRTSAQSGIYYNGKKVEGELPPRYYESRAKCLEIQYGLEHAIVASCFGQLDTAVELYKESIRLMMDTGYTREDRLRIIVAHARAHWSISLELPDLPLGILADAGREAISQGRYDEDGLLFQAIKSLKVWSFPFREAGLVEEGKVGEGFTQEQVRFVLGAPGSKQALQCDDGDSCERWVYMKGHVDFYRDIVIDVQGELGVCDRSHPSSEGE